MLLLHALGETEDWRCSCRWHCRVRGAMLSVIGEPVGGFRGGTCSKITGNYEYTIGSMKQPLLLGVGHVSGAQRREKVHDTGAA